jgi:hypothetical protein
VVVIVAVFVEVWATPVTVKVPVEAPAAIETVAGLTVATVVALLATVTLAPPVGAGPFRAIVPVAVPVPSRFAFDNVTE